MTCGGTGYVGIKNVMLRVVGIKHWVGVRGYGLVVGVISNVKLIAEET